MTTWYLCEHEGNYEMVQSDTVEDLEWMVDGGQASVVGIYTTHLDLVRTKHTVFGDQCTERCCEAFLTDFEAITSIDHHVNAKELWDCVTEGGVYYGENEDTDCRSGDVSTYDFFFGSVENLKCDDCDDYPRRDEGDELGDEALHAAFDAFLDESNDEVDENAYETEYNDWLDGEVSGGVYVKRDGRYFENA
jgi:hypothetical protein